MVLVGYDQEQHLSFRDLDDCEELRYLTLLVPLRKAHFRFANSCIAPTPQECRHKLTQEIIQRAVSTCQLLPGVHSSGKPSPQAV